MNVHTKRNGMWFVRKNVSYDIQNKCTSRSRCAFRRIQTAKKRSLRKSTPIRKTSFRFSGVVHRWKKKYRETSVARWNTAKIYRLLFCSPWGWQLACDLRGKRSERGGGREKKIPDIMAQSLFESSRRTAPHTGLCYRRSAASYANLSSYKHQPPRI